MKVAYITCELSIATLFLPIACSIKKFFPGVENILIDPTNILYESLDTAGSPAEIFCHNGFQGIIIDENEYSDLKTLNYKFKAYLFYMRLFESINPAVIVVPHEFGYAYYAVKTAQLLNIPSFHVQHSIWGPDKIDKSSGKNKRSERSVIVTRNCNYHNWLNSFLKNLFSMGPSSNKSKKIFSFVTIRKVIKKVRLTKNGNKLPKELSPFEDKLQNPADDLSYPINADRIAICGEYYKRQLTTNRPELTDDRIDLTGYIRTDNFYNNPLKSYEAICNQYDLDINQRLAIYFYAPFDEFPNDYEIKYDPNEAVVDAIAALNKIDPNMNILILLHPIYRYQYYLNLFNSLIDTKKFKNVKVDKTYDNHFSLYKCSKIIIGVKSTTLYEAMLANVPILIQVYVLSGIHEPQYIEAGAVASVFSPVHLQKQIERALTDKEYQQRLFENQKMLCNDLFGPIDGKCGERTAKGIVSLIEGYKQ